jgi:hypothetical protein
VEQFEDFNSPEHNEGDMQVNEEIASTEEIPAAEHHGANVIPGAGAQAPGEG